MRRTTPDAAANAAAPPVAAQGLHVRMEAATLLAGVDIAAGRGEMVGVIGPNGAGKTTLLRAIAGAVRPQEGVVLLDGAPVDGLPPGEIAKALAVVPQAAPVTHGFTALEVALMGRYPHLGRFEVEGRDDTRIAREALAMTGVEPLAGRAVETLSGGEQQRVMVSRALTQQTRILLLDEPTAHLDVLHQLRVLGLARRLADEGMTVVAAIHDLTMAARYCHRLVLLCNGRVLAEGAPEAALTPETIAAAFGVRAAVTRDPATGALVVSLLGVVG